MRFLHRINLLPSTTHSLGRIFECSRQFTVDKIDWDLMQDGDVDSALLIAESIAEQSPESLEIIAEYMAVAEIWVVKRLMNGYETITAPAILQNLTVNQK